MAHGESNSRGVAILIGPNARYDFNKTNTKTDQNGRYIIIPISVNEKCLTLCSTYAYNEDKPELV